MYAAVDVCVVVNCGDIVCVSQESQWPKYTICHTSVITTVVVYPSAQVELTPVV